MNAAANIDIRIQRLEQLYQTLDPSPFREKTLDLEFQTYLLDCASEFAAGTPLQLTVQAAADMSEQGTVLQQALHAHFDYLLAQQRRRSKARSRRHRALVLIGLAVLASTLVLRQLLTHWPGPLVNMLTEGLLILGWVALWRPLEVLLFDSASAREQARMLQALAQIKVVWRAQSQASRFHA